MCRISRQKIRLLNKKTVLKIDRFCLKSTRKEADNRLTSIIRKKRADSFKEIVWNKAESEH